MREEAKWWLDDANRCLEKAERMLELNYTEDCVFFCHQALEKLFKGLTIHKLRQLPEKTHSLPRLYKKLEKYVKLSDDLVDFLHMITPYYYT